jgi:hypothetical protein
MLLNIYSMLLNNYNFSCVYESKTEQSNLFCNFWNYIFLTAQFPIGSLFIKGMSQKLLSGPKTKQLGRQQFRSASKWTFSTSCSRD